MMDDIFNLDVLYMDQEDPPPYVTLLDAECSGCGMTGLYWGLTDFGWRLFEDDGLVNGKLHSCSIQDGI